MESAVYVKAPRKFGKTSNVNMIKNFFELEVDAEGKKLPEAAAKNYITFKSPLSNNEHLNIFNEPQFFRDNFGQYPVIHLDFGSIVGRTSAQHIHTFRLLIQDLYIKYKYILPSLTEADQAQFQSLINLSTENATTFIQSGVQLAEYLSKFFTKQCIVLIDELDAPLNQLIYSKMVEKEMEEIAEFLQKFISLLVSNWSVRWVYMTGRTSLAHMFFTEAKNVNSLHYSDSEAVGKFFGFTEDEVSVLLQKMNQDGKGMKEIKEWYGGYSVLGSRLILFNTLSVLMYLKTGKLDRYWTKLDNLEHFSTMFHNDLAGEEILDSLRKNVVIGNDILDAGVSEILSLQGMVLGSENADASLFLQYLHECGYFTLANVSDPHTYLLSVRIPNKEIRIHFTGTYYEAMKEKYGLSPTCLKAFVESVVSLEMNDNAYLKLARSTSALLKSSKKLPENEAELNSILFACVLFWDQNLIIDRVIKTLQGKVGLIILRNCNGNSTKSGIILRVKYGGESPAYAAIVQLIRAGGYNEIFKTREKIERQLIKNKIYVGLGCTAMFDCTISYLCNSLCLENVKNITVKY